LLIKETKLAGDTTKHKVAKFHLTWYRPQVYITRRSTYRTRMRAYTLSVSCHVTKLPHIHVSHACCCLYLDHVIIIVSVQCYA